MTKEEATHILVNATFSDEWQGNEDLTTAYRMAIEALEQEPKTAHLVRWYVNNILHCKCSECSMEYNTSSNQYIRYCCRCGAKMEVQEWQEKMRIIQIGAK